MQKEKGFTLIELLITIAIIGILSSIVISSLNGAREKGKSAAVKNAMSHLLTQGQIYFSDNNSYADATTTSRVGCFASSTFLTDETFFGEQIPSLMVLNIQDNGAPISCAISQLGNSFSMVAYTGAGKFLCRDSNSNMLLSETIDNTSGICEIPPLSQPVVPVLANNGGNLSPTTLSIVSGTKVSFQFTGNNQTRNYSCTNGGPSFTLGPGSTLFEHTFTSAGSSFCKRTTSGGQGVTITITP